MDIGVKSIAKARRLDALTYASAGCRRVKIVRVELTIPSNMELAQLNPLVACAESPVRSGRAIKRPYLKYSSNRVFAAATIYTA